MPNDNKCIYQRNWNYFSPFCEKNDIKQANFSLNLPFSMLKFTHNLLIYKHYIYIGCGLLKKRRDIQPRNTARIRLLCCGLLKKRRDIQLSQRQKVTNYCCGLLKKRRDIQPSLTALSAGGSCGLLKKRRDIQPQPSY